MRSVTRKWANLLLNLRHMKYFSYIRASFLVTLAR